MRHHCGVYAEGFLIINPGVISASRLRHQSTHVPCTRWVHGQVRDALLRHRFHEHGQLSRKKGKDSLRAMIPSGVLHGKQSSEVAVDRSPAGPGKSKGTTGCRSVAMRISGLKTDQDVFTSKARTDWTDQGRARQAQAQGGGVVEGRRKSIGFVGLGPAVWIVPYMDLDGRVFEKKVKCADQDAERSTGGQGWEEEGRGLRGQGGLASRSGSSTSSREAAGFQEFSDSGHVGGRGDGGQTHRCPTRRRLLVYRRTQ